MWKTVHPAIFTFRSDARVQLIVFACNSSILGNATHKADLLIIFFWLCWRHRIFLVDGQWLQLVLYSKHKSGWRWGNSAVTQTKKRQLMQRNSEILRLLVLVSHHVTNDFLQLHSEIQYRAKLLLLAPWTTVMVLYTEPWCLFPYRISFTSSPCSMSLKNRHSTRIWT